MVLCQSLKGALPCTTQLFLLLTHSGALPVDCPFSLVVVVILRELQWSCDLILSDQGLGAA